MKIQPIRLLYTSILIMLSTAMSCSKQPTMFPAYEENTEQLSSRDYRKIAHGYKNAITNQLK